MTVPCPCCKAANTDPVCRRCKADLALLFAIEARREWLVGEARRTFVSDPPSAQRRLEEARTLRSGEDVKTLMTIVAMMAVIPGVETPG